MKTLHIAIMIVFVITASAAAPLRPHESHVVWQTVVAATALPAIQGGGAFTIRDFCRAHLISLAFYYTMKSEGWGPKEMWAGSRRLISFEAAATWTRARETATATGHTRNPKTDNDEEPTTI
jgi:hypothetical protein